MMQFKFHTTCTFREGIPSYHYNIVYRYNSFNFKATVQPSELLGKITKGHRIQAGRAG